MILTPLLIQIFKWEMFPLKRKQQSQYFTGHTILQFIIGHPILLI